MESPGSKKRRKVYSLAVALFAVGAALMVLGFMLAASANERIEGMYSGDLDDMMAVLDDLEEITRTAKWGGYFLTAGQISATIGLLLIAVGLRHSLG